MDTGAGMGPRSTVSAVAVASSVVVRAEAVRKRFGRLEVLKGVSLELRRGETVCLIGPSGSGKTTFIRCINHLEKIDAGRIEVNGRLIGYRERNGRLIEDGERSIARQRTQIGMVFQRFNLFPHKTALENIIEAPIRVLGLPKAQAIAEAESLLARVGLAEKQNAYPREALGRPATARGNRTRTRHEACANAVRRADQRARSRSDRRGAGGDGGARPPGDDHDRRNPRNGLRDAADRVAMMDDGKIIEEGPPEHFFLEPRERRTRQFLSRIL